MSNQQNLQPPNPYYSSGCWSEWSNHFNPSLQPIGSERKAVLAKSDTTDSGIFTPSITCDGFGVFPESNSTRDRFTMDQQTKEWLNKLPTNQVQYAKPEIGEVLALVQYEYMKQRSRNATKQNWQTNGLHNIAPGNSGLMNSTISTSSPNTTVGRAVPVPVQQQQQLPCFSYPPPPLAESASKTGIQGFNGQYGFKSTEGPSFHPGNWYHGNRTPRSSRGINSYRANSTVPKRHFSLTNTDFTIMDAEWLKLITFFLSKKKIIPRDLWIGRNPEQTGDRLITFSVSPDKAQTAYTILKSHQQVGYKKIEININSPPKLKPEQVVKIFQKEHAVELHFLRFRDSFAEEFGRTPALNEVYTMPYILRVKEDDAGRIVKLTDKGLQLLAKSSIRGCPWCSKHSSEADYRRVCQAGMIISVKIRKESLAAIVEKLMESHPGGLYLASFVDCYRSEYGDENQLVPCLDGVPLEHLLNSLPEFCIAMDNGMKMVKSREDSQVFMSIRLSDSLPLQGHDGSNAGPGKLAKLGNEVILFLMEKPVTVADFEAAYKVRFGVDLVLEEYGCSNIKELIAQLVNNNTVEILGVGGTEYVSPTHRQLQKVFNKLLNALVRASADRCIPIEDLSWMYQEKHGRDLNPQRYGVCYMADLLSEVSESFAVVTERCISIKVKERTKSEILNEKNFTIDIYMLLKGARNFQLAFDKLIPAYHQHFGRQCVVAEYGYAKLVELLEGIPEAVELIEKNGQKLIRLTLSKQLMAVGEVVVDILKANRPSCSLEKLQEVFQSKVGFELKSEDYECGSFKELFSKLCKLIVVDDDKIAALNDGDIVIMARATLKILIAHPHGQMLFSEFNDRYKSTTGYYANRVELEHALYPAIYFSPSGVHLSPWLNQSKEIWMEGRNLCGSSSIPVNKLIAFIIPNSVRRVEQMHPKLEVPSVTHKNLGFMMRTVKGMVTFRDDWFDRLVDLAVYKQGMFHHNLPRMNKIVIGHTPAAFNVPITPLKRDTRDISGSPELMPYSRYPEPILSGSGIQKSIVDLHNVKRRL